MGALRGLAALLALAGAAAGLRLGPQQAGLLPAGPGAEYFYWLTPARSGNASAPLLVWLNGGPGASSIIGLFRELGPFTIADDGTIGEREFSWNEEFHVVFVDQPAGTGLSVATSEVGYANNQTDVGDRFVLFLQAFYAKYPSLRRNELWLTGESYAGKYLPAIANAIIDQRLHLGVAAAPIPLKGVAIGNGLTRPREMTLSVPDSYYAVGLLDKAQRDHAAGLAADAVAKIDAGQWTEATHARTVLFDYLDGANGPGSAPNVDNFLVYGCAALPPPLPPPADVQQQ